MNERVYTKNPGMQTLRDESMIDIYKEESVSPEKVFFAFLYCWLDRFRLSKHKLFVCEREFIFSVVIKRKIMKFSLLLALSLWGI